MLSISGIIQSFASQLEAMQWTLLLVNAFLHLIFAGAVARDSGAMQKRGQPSFLVSGFVWAFATLLGGIFVVLVYWIVHYSRFRDVV